MKINYKQYYEKIRNSETGSKIKKIKEPRKKLNEMHWALCFPSYYKYAIQTMGYQYLYFILNELESTFCQRFFLPKNKMPLLSLTTMSKLKNFDVIGFNFNYELNYLNFLKMLKEGGVKFYSKDRRGWPILIAGGFTPTYNPEPLSDFFDAIFIGEAEEAIKEINNVLLKAKKNGAGKGELLYNLGKINGVYIPSHFTKEFDLKGKLIKVKGKYKKEVKKRILTDLDKLPTKYIVTNLSYEPATAQIEILRGCGNFCKFCELSRVYYPLRFRSKESILKTACKLRKYTDKVRLVCSADNDHPEILDIYKGLNEIGFNIIIHSQRADKLSHNYCDYLKKNKQLKFTVAPETGGDPFRRKINKPIKNKDILKAARVCVRYKIPVFELFFIICFPEETLKESLKVVSLVKKVRKELDLNGGNWIRLRICINCHIKKPHTTFERDAQCRETEYIKRINLIKACLNDSRIMVINMNKKDLFIENFLVRGGRNCSKLLVYAFKNGLTVKNWREGVKRYYKQTVYETIDWNKILPWSHINLGVKKRVSY